MPDLVFLTRPVFRYWAKLRRRYLKLGPVTKLSKRNKRSKKFDDDVMSENCDVIVIFPIYGQFGAIRKPNSGRVVCKTYIFINSNLLSYKNGKQLKNCNIALTLLLWVKVLFWSKNGDFLQENTGISKIKRVLVLKGMFSETKYMCVLTCQISIF